MADQVEEQEYKESWQDNLWYWLRVLGWWLKMILYAIVVCVGGWLLWMAFFLAFAKFVVPFFVFGMIFSLLEVLTKERRH